jgi:hypothetical protein
MARLRKQATDADVENVRCALSHLRLARGYLKRAGCPKTLARVLRAITSCGGAVRHAECRSIRS